MRKMSTKSPTFRGATSETDASVECHNCVISMDRPQRLGSPRRLALPAVTASFLAIAEIANREGMGERERELQAAEGRVLPFPHSSSLPFVAVSGECTDQSDTGQVNTSVDHL